MADGFDVRLQYDSLETRLAFSIREQLRLREVKSKASLELQDSLYYANLATAMASNFVQPVKELPPIELEIACGDLLQDSVRSLKGGFWPVRPVQQCVDQLSKENELKIWAKFWDGTLVAAKPLEAAWFALPQDQRNRITEQYQESSAECHRWLEAKYSELQSHDNAVLLALIVVGGIQGRIYPPLELPQDEEEIFDFAKEYGARFLKISPDCFLTSAGTLTEAAQKRATTFCTEELPQLVARTTLLSDFRCPDAVYQTHAAAALVPLLSHLSPAMARWLVYYYFRTRWALAFVHNDASTQCSLTKSALEKAPASGAQTRTSNDFGVDLFGCRLPQVVLDALVELFSDECVEGHARVLAGERLMRASVEDLAQTASVHAAFTAVLHTVVRAARPPEGAQGAPPKDLLGPADLMAIVAMVAEMRAMECFRHVGEVYWHLQRHILPYASKIGMESYSRFLRHAGVDAAGISEFMPTSHPASEEWQRAEAAAPASAAPEGPAGMASMARSSEDEVAALLKEALGSSPPSDRPGKARGPACAKCGSRKSTINTKMMQCGRCQKQYYCTKECQRAHWKVHKKECKQGSK
ncbi:hypothetical protein CYMTET_16554 [Cymbomonas tetramitiformis]|uniref:MYND-type domain-containing protein n=1 Tax=Cymbomonas tetramitiformis TaxID=36881 RepID=A0AAE0GBZ0_9CHLO|nr:hypothetical protein CYMTET_16554 [Cymbomonas tetramitiformis]